MTYPRRSALLAAGLLVTLGAGLGLAAGLAAPTTGASTPLPGRLAYFSDSNDYRTPSTEVLATSRPDGSDRQVLFTNATDSFGFLAYSPSALWEMDADGSGAHLVYRSSRTIDLPAVAPDGRTVAFSVSTNATTSHIVAIPSQGGKSKSLTPLVKGRDDTDPAWSPDGSHLAFLSSRAGRHEGKRSNQLLDGYVMAANGSGVTRVVGLKGNKAGVDWITWGPVA